MLNTVSLPCTYVSQNGAQTALTLHIPFPEERVEKLASRISQFLLSIFGVSHRICFKYEGMEMGPDGKFSPSMFTDNEERVRCHITETAFGASMLAQYLQPPEGAVRV